MNDILSAIRPDVVALERVTHALVARFGARVVTNETVRMQHANTLTWVAAQAPDIVVYPETT